MVRSPDILESSQAAKSSKLPAPAEGSRKAHLAIAKATIRVVQGGQKKGRGAQGVCQMMTLRMRRRTWMGDERGRYMSWNDYRRAQRNSQFSNWPQNSFRMKSLGNLPCLVVEGL